METGGARGVEGARRGAGRPSGHLRGASQHDFRSMVDEAVGKQERGRRRGRSSCFWVRIGKTEVEMGGENGGCDVDLTLRYVVFRCGAEPIKVEGKIQYT